MDPHDGQPTPRTYAVTTFGCQMNEHDSERIAGLLEADGLVPAASEDTADVVVLNTCCIRENADNKLYGTLGHLKAAKARRPGMEIVVGGCLAQKDRDLIQQRAPHVDVVLGTHNVHRAVDLLHESRRSGPLTEIVEQTLDDAEAFPSALPVKREVDHSAWVTIQIGCDNNCAFCIVPAVRGQEVSRSFGDLLDEVRALAADGVTEVTLLGQNVNSYGRDITTRLRAAEPSVDDAVLAGEMWSGDDRRRPRPLFADLLRAVGALDGIRRVRYTSPHPKDLRPETIAAMAEVDAVCEHLHLPLQAGSDRVLAAMHRGYTAERYLEKLAAARATIDDLAVTTDLIVGFPGETEDDFEQTLEVVAAAEYDSAYTFIFSPREGTEAAGMSEAFVPHDVAVARFDRLRAVLERSGVRKHRERIGRVEEVVVEGPSKRDRTVLTGRTRQNKLVHFPSAEPLRMGTYAHVLVTDAAAHHLRGELREVLARPTHRTRIPVVAG
ncbi:tRNA (N6-isopentenyl adenosine(37)-C2)-methylthiotransferase MiaB [Actinomarinicola tropica]|uniref:tRNA-2-methylthio-N(6)-dimethylallyladenosine synthase n=2 Tax=Actinomarinicola tropica TaxID=2789776 RepID=A0A5Q2RMD5_9ACTN|nr:tRNA (N6-isopentenyl adenosine(37)-C2)-methylthiotransferase MiaB [Actinomarinicola tropica]